MILTPTYPRTNTAILQGVLIHFCETLVHPICPGTWFSIFLSSSLLVKLLHQHQEKSSPPGTALSRILSLHTPKPTSSVSQGRTGLYEEKGSTFFHVFIQQTLKCLLWTWESSQLWGVCISINKTDKIPALSVTSSAMLPQQDLETAILEVRTLLRFWWRRLLQLWASVSLSPVRTSCATKEAIIFRHTMSQPVLRK